MYIERQRRRGGGVVVSLGLHLLLRLAKVADIGNVITTAPAYLPSSRIGSFLVQLLQAYILTLPPPAATPPRSISIHLYFVVVQ